MFLKRGVLSLTFRNAIFQRFMSSVPTVKFPKPVPDLNFLLNENNRTLIVENLVKRHELNQDEANQRISELHNLKKAADLNQGCTESQDRLIDFATKFPNLTHPDVLKLKDVHAIVEAKPWTTNLATVRPFEQISKIIHGVHTDNISQVSTERSYYLLGQLAELEQVLIRYAVNHLVEQENFELVSVPDLLHPEILKRCGMDVDGDRTQVYQLDRTYHPPTALSGTAEMALGGLFLNKTIKFPATVDPVRKLVAVSRCYRAETSLGQSEKGIYRVHHFTKVEMFALTRPDLELSMKVHQQFLEIQKTLFSNLGLVFRVLDMPPNDLGDPAYRKYDIEALLPGKASKKTGGVYEAECFGEISSTSNCTDYQSRRLNIRTEDSQFIHTVNGTACAIPRMIMAICEQFQTPNGCVMLPNALIQAMPKRREMGVAGLLEPKPRKLRPHFRFVRSPKQFQASFKESLKHSKQK